MIDQGVWIIVMLLKIGEHDLIIKRLDHSPKYHNYQQCILDKSEEENKQKVPMDCIKEYST